MPAVILDLDGTLVDSRPGVLWSFRAALAELGHPVTAREEAGFVIGPPMAEVWAGLLRPLGDGRVTEAVRVYRAHYAATGRHMNAVFPGVPAALDALRAAGARLIVATAKPGDIGAVIVGALGLDAWAARTYGSVPGGSLDRKENLFAHILRTEPLDPARTAVVGDWRYDMSAARANGLAALGVAWGYDTVDELRRAGAEQVVATPADLPGAVLSRLRSAPPAPPPGPR